MNRNHKFYNIWNQVPVTYYQKGIKHNILQKIWHTKKINLAKTILSQIEFKKCLDIGCASGYMTNQISNIFPNAEYFGIDIYDKAISYAKKTYQHINFKVAFAEKLPFKDKSFDLILFYETIEHVENPLEALLEAKRALNEKGTLLLTMDSGNFLFRIVWFVWEKTKGKVWQGAHIHPFHHNELKKLIKKAKFKIIKKIFSHLGMEVTFVLRKR